MNSKKQRILFATYKLKAYLFLLWKGQLRNWRYYETYTEVFGTPTNSYQVTSTKFTR